MRLFFDTSVLVDLERKREGAVALLETASADPEIELWISTVSVAELLTGAYLRRDADRAAIRAKQFLGQFVWQELDGETAERTAQLLAFLYAEGKPLGFQDAVIAAAALVAKADHLVSEDKAPFGLFPPLAGRVHTAAEMRSRLRRRSA